MNKSNKTYFSVIVRLEDGNNTSADVLRNCVVEVLDRNVAVRFTEVRQDDTSVLVLRGHQRGLRHNAPEAATVCRSIEAILNNHVGVAATAETRGRTKHV